jgi:hypothetical protein
MAFTSGINQLITPAITITFNGSTPPRLLVTGLTGFDSAILRASVENAPQRPGGIVHRALFGPRYPGINTLLHGATAADVATFEDEIKQACASIMDADGRLLFTPPGQGQRFMNVRAYDVVDFQPVSTGSPFGEPQGFLKAGPIPLVAEDNAAYTYTEVDTDITDGGSATITNAGNIDSPPVYEAYGPYTGFVITNTTSGGAITYSGGAVATGHYIEIITRLETAFLDGTGADQARYINWSTANFDPLQPGANVISVSFTGGGGGTKLTVKSNDAWA